MTQYLLSVHMVEGEPMPADDEMQQMYDDVDAFNERDPGRGRLGVRRRPAPGRHRHRGHGRRTATSSRPTARSPRPRSSSAASGSSRPPTSTPRWRGPPRPPSPARARSRSGRSRTSPRLSRPCRPSTPAELEQIFREESGRAVATLVRLFGDIDIAEEAVQEAFVVAVAAVAGRRACRPTRAAGSSPPPATGPSTGCAGSRPATTATPRPRSLHEPRRAAEEVGPVQRRPAPPDLHLLPPGAGARPPRWRSRCACSAGSRRPRSPGPSSCPRRRWPSASCGPSTRSATPSIPYRVPERRRAARPAAPGAGRRLPGLQRGLHRHRGRRPGARRPVRRGHPPGPAAGRADARRARGARAARAAAADRVAPAGPHGADGSLVLLRRPGPRRCGTAR